MILDLHRQGLSVSDIARRTGLDRKTVRRYIARGLEPPAHGPRKPRPTRLDSCRAYLRERVAAYPELRASRLLREPRGMGHQGGHTQLTDFLREVRPFRIYDGPSEAHRRSIARRAVRRLQSGLLPGDWQ